MVDDHLAAADRALQAVHRERRRVVELTSPDFRQDPISGRIVVIAPGRAKRPGARRNALDEPSTKELEECPFDEGREERTPPEAFAVAPPGRVPDTPGWQVRVVPNLYPAFARQEVIVHTPRHVRTLADLSDAELGPIATSWHERLGAAREAGFSYPFLLFNEGREAGASLPHTHSQVVWLEEAPPEAERELPRLAAGACALCDLLLDDTLEIAVDGDLSLRAAPAGRAPYEVLVAPRSHEAEPGLEGLASAVRLLRLTVSRVRALEGPTAVNAWLHHGAHWHFEVVPRLPVLAGLELGGGIFVNWLPPEEAAARLRS